MQMERTVPELQKMELERAPGSIRLYARGRRRRRSTIPSTAPKGATSRAPRRPSVGPTRHPHPLPLSPLLPPPPSESTTLASPARTPPSLPVTPVMPASVPRLLASMPATPASVPGTLPSTLTLLASVSMMLASLPTLPASLLTLLASVLTVLASVPMLLASAPPVLASTPPLLASVPPVLASLFTLPASLPPLLASVPPVLASTLLPASPHPVPGSGPVLFRAKKSTMALATSVVGIGACPPPERDPASSTVKPHESFQVCPVP